MYLQRVRQRLQFQKLLQQFALNFGVQGVNKYKQLGLVVSRVPGESEEFCRVWFLSTHRQELPLACVGFTEQPLGAKDCALGKKFSVGRG